MAKDKENGWSNRIIAGTVVISAAVIGTLGLMGRISAGEARISAVEVKATILEQQVAELADIHNEIDDLNVKLGKVKKKVEDVKRFRNDLLDAIREAGG